MKRNVLGIGKALIIITLGVTILSACSTTTVITHSNNSQKVPPGQAKKAAGSQSAKTFAPGQQKKKH